MGGTYYYYYKKRVGCTDPLAPCGRNHSFSGVCENRKMAGSPGSPRIPPGSPQDPHRFLRCQNPFLVVSKHTKTVGQCEDGRTNRQTDEERNGCTDARMRISGTEQARTAINERSHRRTHLHTKDGASMQTALAMNIASMHHHVHE